MEEKRRVTLHYSREGSARHNDRTFEGEMEHIDRDKSAGNLYLRCYQKEEPDLTFEQAELKFYEQHFANALDAQNQRAIKAGHSERVRDMSEYLSAKKTAPEESLTYLGDKNNSVDAKTLQQVVLEQMAWERKQFSNFRLLDVALHVDEQGAPHIHKRGVWIYHDKDGHEAVGQSKALAEMGVQRPHLDKAISKRNNAKMTYTAQCREHLQQLCKQHGIEIETEPREASRSGRDLVVYQAEKAREELQQTRAEIDRLTAENAILSEQIQRLEGNALDAEKRAQTAENRLTETREQTEQALTDLRDILNQKARAAEIHRVFSDRETQTYHKNMLESTRRIGDEAYRHWQAAQAAQRDIARREKAVQAAEQVAQRDKVAAREMRLNAEKFVSRQAKERANEMSKDTAERLQRLQRLETFCEQRGILSEFERQETRQNQQQYEWEEER